MGKRNSSEITMNEILQFLQDLAAHNDRGWFNENKQRYQHAHMLAVGNYCYDPQAVKVLREDICYGWEEFSQNVLAAADPRFQPDMEGALKKVPKGFDPEAPCADWLRMKCYGLSFNVGNDFLLAPDLAQRVAAIFRTAKPFNDYINRGVDFAKHELRHG